MAKRKPVTPEPEVAPAATDYTVLARRYRPQQFADLVGQEPVAQALANAIQTNRVAHAYLFTGARGVGKTSAARILAKALNCAAGPTATPCGTCDQCRAIASGEDVDVLEIDGASNRGIDEVREIRANVQYRPSRARYKIYIIDEVHMLTTPAFNALLKTLEEPPGHVKFIFATTEVQKIPVTILSRCQRFDFAGIGMKGIVDRLEQIVTTEGMQADTDALTLIARRAGGSMRDAQSLLDQLLAFGGARLTADDVHALLGTAHEERVAALASAVLGREPKEALRLLGDYVNYGQQLGELLDQLIEYWRDLMVVNAAGVEGQDLSVSANRRDALREQATQLKVDTILAGLDILVGVKTRLRASSHTRVLVEMALVRLSQLDDLVSLTQLARWVQEAGGTISAARPSTPPARPNGASVEEKKKVAPPSPNGDNGEAHLELCEGNLESLWAKVLGEIGFALAGDLKKLKNVAISGPNALVIRFSQRYNVPGGPMGEPARLARIEAALTKFTRQPCTVRVEFVPDEPTAAQPEAVTGATGSQQARQQRAEVLGIPLVKKAVEMLGAQLIRADEGFGTPVRSGATPTSDEPDEE